MKLPPGPRIPGRPAAPYITPQVLIELAEASSLRIAASDGELRWIAIHMTQALDDYSRRAQTNAASSAPSERAEWAGGVAYSCERLLHAFADGAPEFRHRVMAHLEKGLPAQNEDDGRAFKEIRLDLIRGFGPTWREHLEDGDLPNPSTLLYLGLPQMIDFVRAVHALAVRAEEGWRREVAPPGGRKKDASLHNLMTHLCSAYRRLFGVLPTVSDTENASKKRETFPGGPAHAWFSELFRRMSGEPPTPDALKRWIGLGRRELAEMEAEFPG